MTLSSASYSTALSHTLSDEPIIRPVPLPTALPTWEGLYQGQANFQEVVAHTPSWKLAAYPLPLPEAITSKLAAIGDALHWWLTALDTLYEQSWKQTHPEQVPLWVSQWLDQGKPQMVIDLARHKRQKSHIPLVIRPDLLWGEGDTLTLCEVDAIPGGLGFTQALQSYYHDMDGNPYLPPASKDLATTWLQAFRALVQTGLSEKRRQAITTFGQPFPHIVVCISDEAKDYAPEWEYFITQALGGFEQSGVIALHPKDLFPLADGLYFDFQGKVHRVDVLYRFFECFDVTSLPNAELIVHAIKKQWLVCSPPIKPHLEEKMMAALWHHPALRPFWELSWQKMRTKYPLLQSSCAITLLDAIIPPTWVLDPTPLPPSAAYTPTLVYQGKPLASWHLLKTASQKARQWVIKPSGFSPQAWGSRGVVIGHDHASQGWAEALQKALDDFHQTPHILQPYHNTQVVPWHALNTDTLQAYPFEARVRLCPYYIVHPVEEKTTLAGVLATGCPKDKKIIHGMKDAIMAPVMAF